MDTAAESASSGRLYIHCPYEERTEASGLGAQWDADSKRWYAPDYVTWKGLSRWHNAPPPPATSGEYPADDFQNGAWLTVPFAEKDEAKGMGARWNKESKQWFASKSRSGYARLVRKWGSSHDIAALSPSSVDVPEEGFEKGDWLAVPFSDKDTAKGMGARWNKTRKEWFAPEDGTNFRGLVLRWGDPQRRSELLVDDEKDEKDEKDEGGEVEDEPASKRRKE
jgi:putative DNA primase/helicase